MRIEFETQQEREAAVVMLKGLERANVGRSRVGPRLVGEMAFEAASIAMALPRPDGAKQLQVHVQLSPEMAVECETTRDHTFSLRVPPL